MIFKVGPIETFFQEQRETIVELIFVFHLHRDFECCHFPKQRKFHSDNILHIDFSIGRWLENWLVCD